MFLQWAPSKAENSSIVGRFERRLRLITFSRLRSRMPCPQQARHVPLLMKRLSPVAQTQSLRSLVGMDCRDLLLRLQSTLPSGSAALVKLELPAAVPANIRQVHDAVRHAYIYCYYSYDLLTLAAAEAFPCLEFALRERLTGLGIPVTNSKSGRLLTLSDLLKLARTNNLIRSEIDYIARMRNLFAHGSDAILNPSMVLTTLQLVTGLIAEMFSSAAPLSGACCFSGRNV